MSLKVGGQAVIEGVMMRTPSSMAVAVRRSDGRIEVRDEPWIGLGQRFPMLRWPIFRGGLVLWESLHNGMSALSWASERYAADEEAKETARSGEAKAEASPTSGGAGSGATMAISMLLAFGVFIALPHLLTLLGGRLLGIAALDGQTPTFHLVAGAVKLCVLVGYMWAISRLPEIRRVFAYHGAEHKSIYAWEAGQELTVENAQQHTRLHPRCGTSFLFIVVLTSIAVFTLAFSRVHVPIENGALRQLAMVAMKLPLMFPIAGIAYELQRVSARFPDSIFVRPLIWPGMLLQRITTQEPDDGQVEVALASLRAALARESEVLAGAADSVVRSRFLDSIADLSVPAAAE
ncbi:MAG: DUF1385 domain-containing protein [Myxococcales bacterium]|nr:DUF1385 domain-containing protein [Myxococcales bacterium]MCB9532266.1 DUF1385 domain-containing protein [Myxococcales bacterium]MCB9533953.1 DUF1385 domain-containing protein [Myxococcales bacterium]